MSKYTEPDPDDALSGDELVKALAALSSPYRLRIIAALAGRRQYVSQLAREMGMSRTLLHMHLRRLEDADLVESAPEVSADGRALNYFTALPFAVTLTPERIAEAVRTLSVGEPE
jgi:DNA-binding transcriptional ArsR family regulator